MKIIFETIPRTKRKPKLLLLMPYLLCPSFFSCRIRVESNDYVPYVVNEGKLLFFLNPKNDLDLIYLVTSGGGVF